MVYSLDMRVTRTPGRGHFAIHAPWIDGCVTAPTFAQAYELALRARARRP